MGLTLREDPIGTCPTLTSDSLRRYFGYTVSSQGIINKGGNFGALVWGKDPGDKVVKVPTQPVKNEATAAPVKKEELSQDEEGLLKFMSDPMVSLFGDMAEGVVLQSSIRELTQGKKEKREKRKE